MTVWLPNLSPIGSLPDWPEVTHAALVDWTVGPAETRTQGSLHSFVAGTYQRNVCNLNMRIMETIVSGIRHLSQNFAISG